MSVGRKATAFMSKQRKRIANVRFTGCKDVTERHLFTYRQRKRIANVRLIMSAFADQNHPPSLTCV